MITFANTPAAHGPRFGEALAKDLMHPGVLTCPPETPIWTVARMMASYSVHAIVVTELDPEGESDKRPWGVVSALDLARAAAAGLDEATAGGIARAEIVTVAPTDRLARVAKLMADHEVEHVVVVDGQGRPAGIVSTGDVAVAIARR